MDLRRQRIENEWSFLERMMQANPHSLLLDDRHEDDFLITLRETAAPLKCDNSIQLRREHQIRLSFARFFPTVPMEAYLTRPVFHPNVHPKTGFVCLWQRASTADTVVEALLQLQRILTYSAFTEAPDHVMQPPALAWARDSHRGLEFPLNHTPLQKPPAWDDEHNFRHLPGGRRQRLS